MRRLLLAIAVTNAGCGELIEEKEYVEPLRVRALSALNCTTCAVIENDGSVWCWGSNGLGQLGDGEDSNGTPKRVELDPNMEVKAKNVSVGMLHACAVTEVGDVYCWGWNAAGQADGKPPTITCKPPSLSERYLITVPPTKIEPLGPALEVAAGALHTCALLSDKTVYCWGLNHAGQCGRAVTDPQFKRIPEAGTCGFTPDSIALAICSSPADILGPPLPVDGLSGVDQLVVQRNTSCARSSSAIRCWGSNCGASGPVEALAPLGNDCSDGGQLGHAPSDRCFQDTPEPVPGLDDYAPKFLSLGHVSGFAIADVKNKVYSWGWNDGQLGYAGTDSFSSPAPVRRADNGDLEQIHSTVRTNGWHQLARAADGTVFSWGDNHRGELGQSKLEPGDDSSSPEAQVADRIPSDSGLLASGQDHSCYELDGAVYCFGHSSYVGQPVDGMGTCDSESGGDSQAKPMKVVFEWSVD